jgi:hypothetical protein
LVYGTVDSEHQTTKNNMKAVGDPTMNIFAANMAVTVPSTMVMAPFPVSTVMPGGFPAQPLKPSKIIELNWGLQFAAGLPADGGNPTNCVADLHIDNIMFYH